MRVLHAPFDVGGNAASLARAERALGLASHAVSFRQGAFEYRTDEVLWRPGDSLFRREIARAGLFRRALRDYDVLHFNFGHSILTWGGYFTERTRLSPVERVMLSVARHVELLDLPAYRRAGKVIAVTYQGDDARQGDYCRAHFDNSIAHVVPPGYYPPWSDVRKRERIARLARYADLIYALNPDLLHVLPPNARFLPYANVDPAQWAFVGVDTSATSPLRVVHAPSHRAVKGTATVIAACEAVRAGGANLELQLVENMTNAQARECIARADVVVDQLHAGWYGGLAVEAMSLGKPVVAYLRTSDLGFIDEAMRQALPVINADPGTVADVLRHLATTRRHELAGIGRAGRAFVERWHDPAGVATTLRDDYSRAALLHRKEG
jgi:glycosyltransferase involved in cell wall biosynthesis